MVVVCHYIAIITSLCVFIYKASALLLWSCLCIYICLVFPSVDVHSLPLLGALPNVSLPSVHSKYLFLFGENNFLYRSSKFLFCNFFLCLKFLASRFLVNIKSFLSVSLRLFINLYIVIKSPLSLFFSSVVSCICFNLSSYVRSSNSGTILVAILCILSNFNTCFFWCRDHITSAYSSFGLIIVVIVFLIVSLSRKGKAIRIFLSILKVCVCVCVCAGTILLLHIPVLV